MIKTISITAAIAIAVLTIIFVSGLAVTAKSKDRIDSDVPTYQVKRVTFTVSVVESGAIKPKDQIILKSEVEGLNPIIFLVPEGARVKQGDLLVELDASRLADQKIDQEISVQNAEAAYIGAKENFAVVENQAKSDIELAGLNLEFARQDLDKYIHGEFPYELDKAQADIQLAQEELTRAQETLKWSRRLFEEKYISQTELQADEIAEKKKSLDVELAQKSKDLLTEYTYRRQLAQLNSDVNQAEMALERAERKAKADVIQAQAELNAKQSEYERQKDKLQKIEDQIRKAKIYAPTDGLVIYATSAKSGGFRRSVEPLIEGKEVREREELIYLPTGNSSKVQLSIHESNLEKIQPGLPVVIKVDAMPGKIFYGMVERIAPLPDAQSMFLNPDLKIYSTEIIIDSNSESLRTGMSCQAEIIVKQYKDVIYVPLQAVVKVGRQTMVYVRKGKSFEPQNVTIGMDNNKMIHIIDGLRENDIVLLNPPLKSSAESHDANSVSSDNSADEVQRKVAENLQKPPKVQMKLKPAPEQDASQQEFSKDAIEQPTPEQIEKMKKQFENMSPEEKEKLQQRFRQRQ